MERSTRMRALLLMMALIFLLGFAMAQEASRPASQPASQQNIPDAPSASKPQQQLPVNPSVPSRPVSNNTAEPDQQPGNRPPSQVRSVPPGGQTQEPGSERDKIFTLSKNVNFVFVPVTVKGRDARMVYGLTQQNFSIYENGERQPVTFFTSDPFPISAAIIVDVGMADVALERVQDTLSALGGTFSEFDEVSYYTFSNVVQKQQEFTAATGQQAQISLRKMKEKEGRKGGAPVVTGPMAGGPIINGKPADPGNLNTRVQPTGNMRTMQPSRVLNDAILRAAIDLSKRDRTRRKMIFIISEGREDRSNASYSDVLKFLLSNEISVYAVAVDSAAIPGYGKLNKIHLPHQGYGNILPKYAGATGGEVFTEFTRDSIEQAYSRITEQARNQYTLGYTTNSAPSSNYRSIEVTVNKPELKVVARDGYYPVPPAKK